MELYVVRNARSGVAFAYKHDEPPSEERKRDVFIHWPSLGLQNLCPGDYVFLDVVEQEDGRPMATTALPAIPVLLKRVMELQGRCQELSERLGHTVVAE